MPLSGPVFVFAHVDGFDLTAQKVASLTRKVTAKQVRSDGLGDTWEEHSPVGTKVAEVTQGGAFFGTDTGQAHEAFKDALPAAPGATPRIITLGFSGDTIGQLFDAFEGAFSAEYELIAARDDLQRANTVYQMTGQHDEGVVLHTKSQETANGDTETSPVDNAASTPNGGVGYLQVFAVSGLSSFVATIRDSTDDITYANLVAFPDNVSAPYGARVTVAGTVNRYLAVAWTGTGFGSITFWVGFARNP